MVLNKAKLVVGELAGAAFGAVVGGFTYLGTRSYAAATAAFALADAGVQPFVSEFSHYSGYLKDTYANWRDRRTKTKELLSTPLLLTHEGFDDLKANFDLEMVDGRYLAWRPVSEEDGFKTLSNGAEFNGEAYDGDGNLQTGQHKAVEIYYGKPLMRRVAGFTSKAGGFLFATAPAWLPLAVNGLKYVLTHTFDVDVDGYLSMAFKGDIDGSQVVFEGDALRGSGSFNGHITGEADKMIINGDVTQTINYPDGSSITQQGPVVGEVAGMNGDPISFSAEISDGEQIYTFGNVDVNGDNYPDSFDVIGHVAATGVEATGTGNWKATGVGEAVTDLTNWVRGTSIVAGLAALTYWTRSYIPGTAANTSKKNALESFRYLKETYATV